MLSLLLVKGKQDIYLSLLNLLDFNGLFFSLGYMFYTIKIVVLIIIYIVNVFTTISSHP